MKQKIIYFFLLLSTNLFAQNKEKVADEGYELVLNTLLKHTVPEVSVVELKQKLDDVILLDTREDDEYQVSHIAGAKHVGYDFFSKNKVKSIDKDTPVVVYCSVGYRSEKISEKLIKMGYQDVANLYGGIFEWVNQGNTVVKGEENIPTEEIHAYDRIWGAWLKAGKKVY
ncbi:MAG: rhodanese-like domain-containing protein [Bacteroidota bacterium]